MHSSLSIYTWCSTDMPHNDLVGSYSDHTHSIFRPVHHKLPKKQVSKTISHKWQSVVLRTHLKSYQIFEILSCECRLLTDSFCCSTFLWSIFHGPFIRSRELGWFICCNILMRLNILVLLVTQVVLRCMNLKYKISTRTKLYTTLSVKSVKRFYMNFRKKHP